MAIDFHAWVAQIQSLDRALAELRPTAQSLGVPPPSGEEWYELLTHKLVPQAASPPALVVAIVGGTNIGKSAIFNHLAGEMASAVSPLAAGTRHPVCLVPEDFDDETALSRLFTGFELQRWHAAEDPLAETPEHRLFCARAPRCHRACCCWIRPTSIPTRRSTGNARTSFARPRTC